MSITQKKAESQSIEQKNSPQNEESQNFFVDFVCEQLQTICTSSYCVTCPIDQNEIITQNQVPRYFKKTTFKKKIRKAKQHRVNCKTQNPELIDCISYLICIDRLQLQLQNIKDLINLLD